MFSLGVIWSSKLQENNERKHTLVAQIGVLSDAFKKASDLKSFDIWVKNYLFLKSYNTSEGAVSHNVLYYRQLSIADWFISIIF